MLFSCPLCRAPSSLARYNNAIVVAQRTLSDLKRHHENAVKAEAEREAKKRKKDEASKDLDPL